MIGNTDALEMKDAENLYRKDIDLISEDGTKRKEGITICTLLSVSHNQRDARLWNADKGAFEGDAPLPIMDKMVRCRGFDCRTCVLATPYYEGC